MAKKKEKALESEVTALIAQVRKELRKIKKLTEEDDAVESVVCQEARAGAKKLLMALKVAK